jgi:hypothetical protein
MRSYKHLCSALMLCLGLMSGCATVTKPLEGIVSGRNLETLTSAVSVAMQGLEKSFGGRGYLVFRQPDSFHIVLLSPFGLTLLEVFSEGENLTCLIPSKGVAYTGRIIDLPDRDGLRSWGMIRWVVDIPPPSGPALYRDHLTSEGIREKVFYDRQGLVIRKESDNGDQVRFLEYRVVNGVPLAEVIEITSATGEKVRLTFSEPEVNLTVDDTMLKPNLEGLKVLPFAAFRGFSS